MMFHVKEVVDGSQEAVNDVHFDGSEVTVNNSIDWMLL
jgi:hypothetical protein